MAFDFPFRGLVFPGSCGILHGCGYFALHYEKGIGKPSWGGWVSTGINHGRDGLAWVTVFAA